MSRSDLGRQHPCPHVDLSEITCPGDRRNCEKCHTPGSQLPPFLRSGVLPTTPMLDGQVVANVPAITSACTSCHDRPAAKAHAQTMTASGLQEACLVCHDERRDWSVSKVHAR